MTETAARAEQIVTSGYSGPLYTWEVPGKPLSVSLPLSLMDSLEQETVQSFRSLSSRGSEMGGVLFGTVAPGKPAVVTISSFEPVPCEYSLGPLYHLSETDLVQLDRIVSRARATGMSPVGFFRSHTRKGLSIDADDLKLLDLRFPDPHSIALLVRPFAAKASMAGIFFREGSEMRTESSYLEFPLRSPQVIAAAKPATPAGARAQIVPIASRREPMLADLPLSVAPDPAPVPTPAAESPSKPAGPVAKPTAEPVSKPTAEPASKPTAEPLSKKATSGSLPASIPATEPELEEPASRKLVAAVATAKGGNRVYIYVAAAVLVVAGLLSAGYFSGMRRGGTSSIAAKDSGLALRVERTGAELLLSWNRDAASILNAKRAVLEINDGTQHENVEMDLAQLRNGTIIYSPVTADVVFRMDITGADQKQLVSESVRVLRPSPLTPDAPQQQPQQSGAAPVTPANGTTAAAAPVPEAAHEEETKPAAPPRATKAFNTESLAQRLRPTTSTNLPDAPTVANQASAVASLPAGLASESSALPAPPPPPAPTKAAAPLGGQIETARLVSRKDPEYPKMAREAGAKGAVKLVATVGVDGHVVRVKAVSGHPLLIRSATEAVMEWVYRPTFLNGVPVETQTDITLNFVNDR